MTASSPSYEGSQHAHITAVFHSEYTYPEFAATGILKVYRLRAEPKLMHPPTAILAGDG